MKIANSNRRLQDTHRYTQTSIHPILGDKCRMALWRWRLCRRRCLYWHSCANRFDFLSLCLCAKRTEFSNAQRTVGGQSASMATATPYTATSPPPSPFAVPLLPLMAIPIQVLSFSLIRCEFIAKCIALSFFGFCAVLSPSQRRPWQPVGLSAVKQRRHRRTHSAHKTHGQSFC